jgi:hypothetical protein
MKKNEAFDDFMQKYFHEETPISNILSGEQMIGGTPVGRFFKRIFWDFKPLSDCLYESTSQNYFKMTDDVFTFIFRNSEYYLCVSFHFEVLDKCDFCVFYQTNDYSGEEVVDLFSPGDCMHLADYENKSSDEVCKILRDTFEQLLKKLGFEDELNKLKEWRKIRGN